MSLSVSLDAVALAAFGLLVGTAGFLLYVQRPALAWPTVFASLPWFVAAAVLRTLRGPLDYPTAVEPLLAYPWVYVLMGALCVLVWTGLVQLRTAEEPPTTTPAYLGLVGLGALLVPFVVLVILGGAAMPPTALLAWLVTPVIALVATYAALVAFGLWLPRTTAFAGSAGAVVVFGLTFDAVLSAFVVTLGGQPATPVVFAAESMAGLAAVDPAFAVVWTSVWLRLAAAVAVVAGLAALHRSRPTLAERGLHATAVVAVLLGANAFVAGFAGGVIA